VAHLFCHIIKKNVVHLIHFVRSPFSIFESASSPLVNFGVLNDNLIKGLISCVKCIRGFLVKVQMHSLIHHLKYHYEANGTI
jgi:hypothetical protein